jgi:hypothetical protein
MKDYSQYGEQRAILKVLGFDWQTGEGPPGRLLEIGAWDPIDKSNSRALIELGWSAVLFEPSPGPLRKLVKEYGNNPKVEVVGIPVTVGRGFLKLRVTDDALSAETSNELHLGKWGKVGGFYGTMTSYSIPMLSVLKDWGNFDFVSIDTEGTSIDLFEELLGGCKNAHFAELPRCVCVEHDSHFERMEKLTKASGYRLAFLNDCNAVLERE